jgi:hypothetical protein
MTAFWDFAAWRMMEAGSISETSTYFYETSCGSTAEFQP